MGPLLRVLLAPLHPNQINLPTHLHRALHHRLQRVEQVVVLRLREAGHP